MLVEVQNLELNQQHLVRGALLLIDLGQFIVRRGLFAKKTIL